MKMKFQFSTIVLLFVLVKSGNAQSIFPDTLKPFKAVVYKMDSNRMENGILWDANEDGIQLLSRSQFYKWKQEKLTFSELKFGQIKAENLKYLKLTPENKRGKSMLHGALIGAAIGFPLGLYRRSLYDANYCAGGDDAVAWKCIGGENRLTNNVVFGGVFGGLLGLAIGPMKVRIQMKNGKESYQMQLQKIKKCTIVK